MNVIVVVTDSLRRDHLGAYGDRRVSTPCLDRFYGQATVFDHAFAGSHPTVPNRTDSFTGKYTFPWRNWSPLPPGERVLSQILKEHGVVSMLIGDTYHLFKDNYWFHRGFTGFEWIRGQEGDKWVTDSDIPLVYRCPPEKMRLPYPERYDEIIRNRAQRRREEDWSSPRVFDRAMRWLEHNRGHRRWLLWVDCFDPHEPWDPPEHYLERYAPEYAGGEDCDYPVGDRWRPFYTPRELKRLQARYAAEVTLVDRWFGRFLQKVEDLGLLKDTLVVHTTDHGLYVGHPPDGGLIGKPLFTNREIFPIRRPLSQLPLAVRVPGVKPRRNPAIVQPCDLMPTILEALGLPRPRDIHGRSYLAAARGRARRLRPHALTSEHLRMIAVSTARHTAQFWPASGPWEKIAKRRPAPVLTDLKRDPRELKNIAAREPALLKRLHRALVRQLEEIKAPPDFIDRYRTF